ncbi:MAG: hypothetical protein ACI9MC_003633 [Kiritimatiellia bacterium]|jgi:hypothetical protein
MIALLIATSFAAPGINDESRPYEIELTGEVGFLAPVSHTVQFGSEGDELNYVQDGGQDNLFPFVRPTLAIHWKRQVFTAVWQPLQLNTIATLDHDLRVDDVVFEAGRPIYMRYGFSFWRLSWAHKAIAKERSTLSLGLGLQVRNATIGFTAVDGSKSEFNRDIGPVPLLELEYRTEVGGNGFFEAEVDGFYAPIKYLNGRGTDVEGAIADIQLRGGLHLKDPLDAFVGLRYIGGGASGTGSPDATSDGYTKNWLHFLTFTAGFRIR